MNAQQGKDLKEKRIANSMRFGLKLLGCISVIFGAYATSNFVRDLLVSIFRLHSYQNIYLSVSVLVVACAISLLVAYMLDVMVIFATDKIMEHFATVKKMDGDDGIINNGVKVVKSTVAVTLWAVLGFIALYFNYSADRMGGLLIQNQIIADKAASTPIVSSRNSIAQNTLSEAEKAKEKRIGDAEKALAEAKANKTAAIVGLLGKNLADIYFKNNDWALQKAEELYGSKLADLKAAHDVKITSAQVFLDSTTTQMNAMIMAKTATLVNETEQHHKGSQDYNDAIESFTGNFSIGALLLIVILVCLMKLEGYDIYGEPKKGKSNGGSAQTAPHHSPSTVTHHTQSAQGYPKR